MMHASTARFDAAPFTARSWLLLAVLVGGQAMIAMDFSLASVALPSISQQLSVEPAIAQWVISAMQLGFGGFLIVGGRLADIYGQKRCLIAGLALYTAGALGSGLSGTIGQLIAGRALQGVGGALMFPAILSLIFLSFAEGPPRFRALTVSMTAQFLASPVGVIIAGSLIAALGWRGAFLVSVPIGLACVLAAPGLIASSPVATAGRQSVDIPGAILSTLGCALLVWTIPPLLSGHEAASSATWFGFVASFAVLGGFVVLQRRSSAPLVSAETLRCQNLVIGTIVATLITVGLAGLVGLALIAMQQGLHFSPFQAGLGLLPYGIMSLLISLIAPRLAPIVYWKPHLTLVLALSIVAGCHLLVSLGAATPNALPFLLAALLVAPAGGILGLNLAMSEALRSVGPERQGIASALLYAAIQIGIAIGVSLMVSASGDPAPVLGTTVSLAAFAASFRIGAVVCILGIGFSLLIASAPHNTEGAVG